MLCNDYKLGESFSLYIKYSNEMEYFRQNKESDLAWVDEGFDKDKFRKTVKEFHEEAFGEFKKYLQQVHEKIYEHVSNFATIKKASLKGKELCRDVKWNIWRKGDGKPNKDLCQIGGYFWLNETGEYCVDPWIWVITAKRNEKILQKIVGMDTRHPDVMPNYYPGTIALGCESIKLRPLLGCGTSLIEALTAPFISLEGKKWQRILDLAYKGNEKTVLKKTAGVLRD